MTIVNIYEAKTHLSRLLARVEAGEEIIIARNGRPIARLMPEQRRADCRTWGLDEGIIDVPDGLDAPLPEDVVDLFYESELFPK